MKTDNKKLNKIAQKVLEKIPNHNKPDKFGFVLTTLMIISIVLTIIRVIQECNKNKLFKGKDKYEFYGDKIKNSAIKNTWYTNLMLRKIARQQLGYSNYREHGKDVINAILKTGETLTDDEIITLVEAANV